MLGRDMALSGGLLLVVLFAVVSHGAEPGAPYGRRRKVQSSPGASNALQPPAQSLSYSEDRGGPPRARPAEAGGLSHRSRHPLARPEDDGTGLEGLSPVRVEAGPSRERARSHAPFGIRENQLLGTRKGAGPGFGNGRELTSELWKPGGRRDKRRHRKGEFMMTETHKNPTNTWGGREDSLSVCLTGFLPESELSSEVGARDRNPPSSSSFTSSPSLGLTPPDEPPSPIISVSGSSTVTTATNEHPPTLLPASSKPQVTQRGWRAGH